MTIPGVRTRILDGQLGGAPVPSDGLRVVLGTSSLGTVNEIVPLTDPLQVRPLFGFGALPEALGKEIAEGGGTALGIRTGASVAGTVTPAVGNPADPEITLANAPTRALLVQVRIVKAGARGTATFQYSLDGGDSWSLETLTSATFEIPDTPHSFEFAAGNYVAGETYWWTVTAPSASIADLQAAIRAVVDSDEKFEFIHVAQSTDASVWAAVDSLMVEAAEKNRYCFVILEGPAPEPDETVAEWNTRANAEIASFQSASKRLMIVAPSGEMVDALDGLQQMRNLAVEMAARLAAIEPHINPAWPELGPVKGITTVAPYTQGTYKKVTSYNNGVASSLDNAGYATVYTLKNRKGWFWMDGRMAVPATSDYYTVVNRRIMDRCTEECRDALINFLFKGVDPTDLDAALAHMKAVAAAPLARRKARKHIVAYEVTIPPGQDLLSSRELEVIFSIVPLGYPRTITMTIGFKNPLLGVAA